MSKTIKPYTVGAANDAAEVSNESATTAIAQTDTAQLGTISGEIEQGDIIIPRLNIVQNVGALGELFDAGQIVLNQETPLVKEGEAIELTVLNVRKVFQENVSYDSDERPAVYNTLEEVKAAGGSIEWGANGEKPSFLPVLHTQVLIKAPEGAEGAFPFEFEGASYALALWTIKGVAYTRAGKNIVTAARFALKD
ncbi:MAG: hypothetical protein R3Y56_08645, partial [Akkermansia sp.]